MSGVGAVVGVSATGASSSVSGGIVASNTARGLSSRGLSSRSMSTADGVVDVQNDLRANLEIEEARRVTSKELNLSRDFSTGEKDKLDTISITGETSIVIDNPDEFDGFNNRDDLCGLL